MTPEVKGTLVLGITVVTEDETQAARAGEVMARAAVGLALDGISASFSIGRVDDDDEDPKL